VELTSQLEEVPRPLLDPTDLRETLPPVLVMVSNWVLAAQVSKQMTLLFVPVRVTSPRRAPTPVELQEAGQELK
jgi:hypothetical protein